MLALQVRPRKCSRVMRTCPAVQRLALFSVAKGRSRSLPVGVSLFLSAAQRRQILSSCNLVPGRSVVMEKGRVKPTHRHVYVLTVTNILCLCRRPRPTAEKISMIRCALPGSEGQNGKECPGRWVREREPKASSRGPHAVLQVARESLSFRACPAEHAGNDNGPDAGILQL